LGAAAVGTAAPLPVYHLRLQQVTTVVAAAAGSCAEATAQGTGVLVRCGVARGCCTHAAGHTGAREESARHRSEWCCPLRFVASLSMSCMRCCTVAPLAAGATAALTTTIPAASPLPFFPSCPFPLPRMRASCRGMDCDRMCVTVCVC
jgi:hypothetical protein